jgi:hypothetical protein
MTTSQEVSSSKHKIDSLTSDFFRAVSFFEGTKPAYQNLYKLFIESGQLIICLHSAVDRLKRRI